MHMHMQTRHLGLLCRTPARYAQAEHAQGRTYVQTTLLAPTRAAVNDAAS